jgi:hypothetical protein
MPNVSRVDLIGREREPLATIDDFADDPDALRTAAGEAAFAPAGEHYPGLRAPLPSGYLAGQLPVIAQAVSRAFGRCRRIHVVDAAFSIVTRPAADLHIRQRLPHVDAYGQERIALVHYLSPTDGDGTAFFRHRATGFETIDATRAPGFFGRLDDELREGAAPVGYIAGDTALFERTAVAPSRYNRALLYRSYMLHSGAISPDASLSPDPALGRLTVTGFFAIE